MAEERTTDSTKRIARAMPYNADAESAVLGSILIDSRMADDIVPTMSEGDFFVKQNRIVFAVMKELQERLMPIDTVSVADRLNQLGKLDEAGSVEYLASLADSVPSSAGAEHYAEIVKRDALTRRVIFAANNIVENAYKSETGTGALEFAEREIFSVAEETSERSLVQAAKAMKDALNSITDIQNGNVPQNIVRSEFKSLDRMTKGFKPGELILLAARPSVGKTAFALNIAANVVREHKNKEHKSKKIVAIFSLEMEAPLLAKRMLSYVSGVPLSRMDTYGAMTTADDGKLMRAFHSLYDSGLYIDDYKLNTPGDVLSKCRRLKRERGLDLVIIDYLQLMTTGRDYDSNRQQAVSDMSRNMKLYAGELGVPIIVLSQMSRDVEKRDDHSPKLSDLRESGAIEQDADVVMFLHKPAQFNPAMPEDVVQLIVRKNRNGPVGEIDLKWEGDVTSFREYAKEELEEAKEEAKRAAEEKESRGAEENVRESSEEEPVSARPDGEYKDALSESASEGEDKLRAFGEAAVPPVSSAEESVFEEDASEIKTEESPFEEGGSDDELPFDTGDVFEIKGAEEPAGSHEEDCGLDGDGDVPPPDDGDVPPEEDDEYTDHYDDDSDGSEGDVLFD